MKTGNKILAIVFLAVIFIMLPVVVAGPVIYCVDYSSSSEDVDLSAAYPFRDGSSGRNRGAFGIGDTLGGDYGVIRTLEGYVKSFTTDHFYFQTQCVIVKKTIDRAIGLDMTTSLTAGENDLSNDFDLVLPYDEDCLGFAVDDIDISSDLGSLIDFADQVKNDGRDFLFFMVPGKYTGNDKFTDYSQKRLNTVLSSLNEKEIDVLDLNGVVEESGLKISSLFFKTDHHWLPSTGIWADKLLCEYMNENYGYDIDTSIFDPENYETTVLENHFLGSLGKKVTTVYTSLEDFPVVEPKYDTDLEIFDSKLCKTPNETLHGSIQETMFNYSALKVTERYSGDAYLFYGYGDKALTTIHNNDIHDGSRILILKTSFADCMYPYLSAVFEYIDVVDLRHFNGSLQTFIDETNPDTVVMIYGLTSFNLTNNYGLFDFR